jgi:hypothetical protein
MKTILFILIAISCFIYSANAQNVKGDSLHTGRVCKLILYNGFQTEGRITARINDTLTFKTDITDLFIPVKDIKFVLNPEVELSDIVEFDSLKYNDINVEPVKIDTTEECDIYMNDKSVLVDVKLITVGDSTIKTVKDKRSKNINIAGIRKIVFKTSAPFGKGYLYGSAVGFGIGFFTLAFHDRSGEWHIGGVEQGLVFGLICSIPAGLIGGVIGVLTAADDVYLFDNGVYPAKIKRMKFAMEKHY